MNFEDASGTDYKVKFDTLKAQVDRIQEDARTILELFGARKRSDGSFNIDFVKLAENLGEAKWAELRGVILELFGASAKAPAPTDPAKFAAGLTIADALKFRAAIDAHHRISGAAGEKPRVRVTAPMLAAPVAPKAKRKKRRKKRKDAGVRRATRSETGVSAAA